MNLLVITLILISLTFTQNDYAYKRNKTVGITLNVISGPLSLGHYYAQDYKGQLKHFSIFLGGFLIGLQEPENEFPIIGTSIMVSNWIWSLFTVSDFIEGNNNAHKYLTILPKISNTQKGLSFTYSF